MKFSSGPRLPWRAHPCEKPAKHNTCTHHNQNCGGPHLPPLRGGGGPSRVPGLLSNHLQTVLALSNAQNKQKQNVFKKKHLFFFFSFCLARGNNERFCSLAARVRSSPAWRMKNARGGANTRGHDSNLVDSASSYMLV